MDSQKSKAELSRRDFLRTVGVTAPTLSLMAGGANGTPRPTPQPEEGDASGKFTPIDLSANFNCSSREFGTREDAPLMGGDSAKDLLIRVPGGKRDLQGVPFLLGPEDLDSKGWLVLTTKSGANAVPRVEIPLQQKAHFICLASFTDFDEVESPKPGDIAFEKVGQHLAEVTLVYEDDGTHVLPIRRRFESNGVGGPWGHLSFGAVSQGKMRSVKLTDPLASGTRWGDLQKATAGGEQESRSFGIIWICALENPEPDKSLRAIRVEATGEDALVVCGLTLYHRPDYPLRFEPRAIYRITLPEPAPVDLDRWRVEVDLGWIGRTFTLPDFQPEAWLESPAAGLGERAMPNPGTPCFYVEVVANVGATLTLNDSKNGKTYAFEISQVVPGAELAARGGRRNDCDYRARPHLDSWPRDRPRHQEAHSRASGPPLERRPLHPPLRAPYGHQRCMVPGLRR